MYIWRGKNRRDRRENVLIGHAAWVPREITHNPDLHAEEDELLRFEQEKKHVAYFSNQISDIMNGYLETETGKKELNLVVQEIEKDKERSNKLKTDTEKYKELLSGLQPIIFQLFSSTLSC